VLHLAHMLLFAGILSTYFAFLLGRRGRRLRFGVVLFASLAGGGLAAGLLMYPFA
jgi:hypothetical protein